MSSTDYPSVDALNAKRDDNMTQIANQTHADALAVLYRPIEKDLADATELLKNRLRHVEPAFDAYLDYSFKLGGKRLRPALVLLCGKAAGTLEPRHALVAAALEMIHTGSLVHDDILDGAEFRRQLETVNAKWDSQRAVLIGDLLITRAFELICDCDDSKVFRELSVCCKSTVEGELYQTESVGNFQLTPEDYRKIVGGKTASLLECSASLGAYLAGANDEEIDAFAKFGQALGVAFQIVDDVLDLVGDEEKVGKTLGTDLENKKETLPLIIYLQKAPDEERKAFLKRMDDGIKAEERADVAQLLRESGAIDEALDRASNMIDEALNALKPSRERAKKDGRKESLDAFEALEALARFVVKRDK